MSLAVVGLSHRTAPIDVRERFVFDPEDAAVALVRLTAEDAAGEAVLLSTCNRTELYLADPDRRNGRGSAARTSRVAALLGEHAAIDAGETEGYLYSHHGRDAVRHLFRVVTSLDSMVVGEAQIQGQVKDAYERAAAIEAESGVVGPVVSRLFQTALSVGGRVRNRTALGTGAASVPSAAVELAGKIFGSLEGRRALVLGAGEMSELAIECLTGRGVGGVLVANRTEERARALAERTGGRAVSFDSLAERLPEVEILTTATAAPRPVVTRELMERVFPDGPARPLLMVDIALPRDIDPAVGELENVFLYDIDDLRQIVDGNLERRREEIPVAEEIIDDAVDGFWAWYAARDVVPLIRTLRGRAEAVRQAEVDKALRELDHLEPGDRERVEVLTRQVLNKVLHRPTVRLREAASNGQGPAVIDAARYLFALDSSTETGES